MVICASFDYELSVPFVAMPDAVDNVLLAQKMYAIRDEEIAAGFGENIGHSNVGSYPSYDILKRSGFDGFKQFILTTMNACMVKGKWFAEPDVGMSQLPSKRETWSCFPVGSSTL